MSEYSEKERKLFEYLDSEVQDGAMIAPADIFDICTMLFDEVISGEQAQHLYSYWMFWREENGRTR